MATSTTSTPKPAPKAEPAAASLYELQQQQVPPPATPTQAELDAMMTGNYDPMAPEGQRVKQPGRLFNSANLRS